MQKKQRNILELTRMLLGTFSEFDPPFNIEIKSKSGSLRTEREPYVGLLDCAKRIVDEEGWTALYRAWWLTMLGCLTGAFS